jgi:uncharacterized protein (DUF1501 family)
VCAVFAVVKRFYLIQRQKKSTRRHIMQRRHFLQSLALSSGILLPIGRSAFAVASEPNPTSTTRKKLIVIMLRGAVDGLSVVAPLGEPNYARLRPTIALAKPGQENGAIDLDGYFGLHPALADLQTLWNEKKLAFVHASGSPDITRSHFDAQDYMESATPGKKSTDDGWMNRLLAVLPGDKPPTRALAVGPVMPRIFSGSAVVTNIASGDSTRATMLDSPAVAKAFDQMYQGKVQFAQQYQDAKMARKDLNKAAMGGGSDRVEMLASNGAPLPNGFPADAARLATMMKNDDRIQMAFMALGGWDTHVGQGNGKGKLANLLAPLGQGLAALSKQLGSVFEDTTIVVMSEFGRTAKENGTGGSDHGHGNVMWVLGGKVQGGKVHGQWTGLGDKDLYEGRDLAVTTDFRSVLAHIAERHLSLTDKQLSTVFPIMPAAGASVNLLV